MACELDMCYMLSQLQAEYGNYFGLYRDEGFGILAATPREIENIKKNVCKIFQRNGLKIVMEANKKTINFPDVTLDLSSQQYMPYMKPSNNLRYININSNHPPIVLKNTRRNQ